MSPPAASLGCLKPSAAVVIVLVLAVAAMLAFALHAREAMGAPFNIENRSGEDIWVTPIGMEQYSGKYAPLPLMNQGYFAYHISNHDIFIPSGETLSILYMWLDISFRHILVRTSDNEVYIVDTDKRGGIGGSVYTPLNETYIIGFRNELSKAPEELLPCIEGESVAYSGAVEYIEQKDGTFLPRPFRPTAQ